MEDAARITALAILGLFPALEITCYVLLFMKRTDLAVRKRSMNVVLFASIASWLAYLNLIFSATNRGSTCGVFYAFSLLIPPIAAGSQLIRSIELRAKLERSNILLKEERVHTSSQQARRRGSRSHSERSPDDAVAVPTGTTPMPPPSTRAGSVYAAGREKIEKSKAGTRSLLRSVKWLLLYTPTLLLSLATYSDPAPDGRLGSSTYMDCLSEPIYFLYICPAVALLVVLLTLITTTLIRKSEDELGIRSEITRNAVILACTYVAIIIVRLTGRNELHPLLEAIQQLLLTVSMKLLPCFHLKTESLLAWTRTSRSSRLQKSGVPGYARPLPSVGNSRSSTLRRVSARDLESEGERRREVTMSLDAGLCILLSTQDGINSFSEHCVREFSYENIRFWCAVNDFHAEVDLTCIEDGADENDGDDDDVDGGDGGGGGGNCVNDKLSEAEILDYAKEIFEMYVATEGEMQINIPATLVAEIRKSLESGSVRRDVFDKAQKETFALMSRDSYPRYLATKRKTQSLLEKSRSSRRTKRVSAIG